MTSSCIKYLMERSRLLGGDSSKGIRMWDIIISFLGLFIFLGLCVVGLFALLSPIMVQIRKDSLKYLGCANNCHCAHEADLFRRIKFLEDNAFQDRAKIIELENKLERLGK